LPRPIDFEYDAMPIFRRTGLIALVLLSPEPQLARAQTPASIKPYQVEWVYRDRQSVDQLAFEGGFPD
jgi:hypothetical protein